MPGGFEVMSYVTLLIPVTSLIILVAVSAKKLWKVQDQLAAQRILLTWINEQYPHEP